MNWCRFLFILLTVSALALPTRAGSIFGKQQAKPTPAERVPELLGIIQTNADEHKRLAAAEELRQYDPAVFPAIIPVLIEVLRSDAKPAVRSEAVETLSKLRPVTQQAGIALELAMQNDASMRVRLQARSALLMYHWAGYHTTKLQEAPVVMQSKEPPLATEPPPAVQAQPTSRINLKPKETTPPPLAPTRSNQGPDLVPFN